MGGQMGAAAPVVAIPSLTDELGLTNTGTEKKVVSTVTDIGQKIGLVPERQQAPSDQVATPNLPSRDSVNTAAITEQMNGLKRKRASRTLLGGTTGMLDTPTAASSVLIGS